MGPRCQRQSLLFLVIPGLLLGRSLLASDPVRYDLRIELEPETHQVRVSALVTLPRERDATAVEFLLNRHLEIKSSNVELVSVVDEEASAGDKAPSDSPAVRYRLTRGHAGAPLAFEYEGTLDFPLLDQEEEYARGFRETLGALGEDGVYFAGSSFWYPIFGDDLFEFRLQALGPADWHLISQGDGTSRDPSGGARWSSEGPMEEIYLVGGRLARFHEIGAGGVTASVYLHAEDPGLASRYLSATFQYLEMYQELLGPYPYSKFALVENFWETGYGMPSFTLLGPTVIRLPFILHSSYPHEILHNWWGNSVFVDLEGGNWCEGLTAYLADHLIQEQRGSGAEYRRSTLQRYRDFVQKERDLPLADFRARHSAASEAVGYGKGLMGFHDLRRRLGDASFRTALARFYQEFRGRRARFSDLRQVLESVSGMDLGRFFDDWTQRPGAPSIAVVVSQVKERNGGFVLQGRLDQVQDGKPYSLQIPVALQTEGGTVETVVAVDEKRVAFTIDTDHRPLRLAVDPQFDLFRRLDPRETPPSIGRIFGDPTILAVLPSQAPEEERRRYQELVSAWQSPHHEIEFRLDSQVEALDSTRSVWLLGSANLQAAPLHDTLTEGEVEVAQEEITLQGETVPFAGHSTVLIGRHPQNPEKAVGWIVADPPQAFAGLARKLPHYGKYSYLAFEGAEPTNVIKGQWRTTDSPLEVDLRDRGETAVELPPLDRAARAALAELPPVFSQSALVGHVSYLASPELEGRGLGSEGLSQAAHYIADKLKAYGLAPGGADSSYFQPLTVPGPDGDPVLTANVVAYLPGTEPSWRHQSVLLTAHFDHLGRGWPDVHAEDRGRVHPGADDNASGVAVLLELARAFASDARPRRNLVFIAFTGEEAGRLGSRYFVEHPVPFPLPGIRGVLNLDTVGRLEERELQVLGSGSATEWPHIFRGSTYVTGVKSKMIPTRLDASDHTSFLERNISAVQIFSGAHTDYHRPTDTVEKIDPAGLVKVAAFVKEALAYLAEREAPLTVTLGGQTPTQGSTAGGRRVSFGSLPDFSYEGPGVRFEDVVPNSPAEESGLEAGDVLLAVDDTEVGDLRQFSAILRQLKPGQTIRARVRRGEEVFWVTVELAAR